MKIESNNTASSGLETSNDNQPSAAVKFAEKPVEGYGVVVNNNVTPEHYSEYDIKSVGQMFYITSVGSSDGFEIPHDALSNADWDWRIVERGEYIKLLSASSDTNSCNATILKLSSIEDDCVLVNENNAGEFVSASFNAELFDVACAELASIMMLTDTEESLVGSVKLYADDGSCVSFDMLVSEHDDGAMRYGKLVSECFNEVMMDLHESGNISLTKESYAFYKQVEILMKSLDGKQCHLLESPCLNTSKRNLVVMMH